jgi:hypothetical protein
MSDTKRKISTILTLKIAALFLFICLSLLLVCLFFLPTIITSQSAQNLIKKTLSASMKRQVAWSGLAMTWSDGLNLSGLKLGEGPAPLLNAEIDQIVITPSLGRGDNGRFGVDLAIRINNVRTELARGPAKPSPPPSAKDPLTLLAESIQRIQELDFPLPVDLRVMLDVNPMQVTYQVPVPGKNLQLEGFSFHFAMPSLGTKPVIAEANGLVSVDGHKIGSVSFKAKVSDLVTKEQRLRLANALFAIDAVAPGTSLTFSGGVGQVDGLTARLILELPQIMALTQPLLPPSVPKLSGKVDMLLLAKNDKNRDLIATLKIDGTGVGASGGSLKTKQVGPIDLKLHQNISTDHLHQKVDFSGGIFAIPGLMNTAWSASVKHPTLPERSLDINLGPLRIDLARALTAASPFLPSKTFVKDLTGELFLRSLHLELHGQENKGDVAISGLGVTVPHVKLAQKNGYINAENIEVNLEKLECPLVAKMPTKLTANLLWSFKKADQSGTQAILLQGGRGKLFMLVNDLDFSSRSPRKLTGSAVVTQVSDLDQVSVGSQLFIKNVHKQVRLLARAADNGDILASLPECSVTVASLHGFQSGKRFGPIPLFAALTATGLNLPADRQVKPSLKLATADISVGDFLRIAGTAALSGGVKQQATTSGTVRADLHRALLFAATFVPTGLKAEGSATAVWDLAAPLPEKGILFEKNPLRSARTGLALCDKLDVSLKLGNISATIPSVNGKVNISGLHTGSDLRFSSIKNGNSLLFDGLILFSGASNSPGVAEKLPVQHASLLINGEISDWSALRLHEELRIDPLALSHEAELNVNRINLLLDENQPLNLATLIKRLDATLFATVEAAFPRELKLLLPGLDVAGNLSGSARVDLSAGREVAIRSALKTTDFGLQLANGTKVEGMHSDIIFNRVYSLAATSQGDGWTPLSSALVKPVAVDTVNPGATEIAGRIQEDLRGDISGTRSFSIRRVTTKTSSGVPLVLTALEGDLLVTQEKAGISFFQGDLLGGTLMARSVFDLKPDIPVLSTAGSFSNLDITYLLPKNDKRRRLDQDSEITGEMSLTAPLIAEQRELFEQLRLTMSIRKIGADTIERALFSLDPYERNEQVVAQRKMLRSGNLKWLRATAVDGAFSMEGEARIKGVAVDLPKVERLRISELPQRQELLNNRKTITSLRSILELVRSDTLVVGPKGELSLKRRSYEK